MVSHVSEQNLGVDFFYVDVDESPDLAAKFSIMSIPALVQIKNGKETNRSIGFIPEDTVKEFALS